MVGMMGLNWRQQKELLKLRAKLSFRQFMGEKARLLVAIMTVVVAVPIVIGLAAATGAGYYLLPDQWPTQLMGFVLVLSWVLWCVAPVFSFHVNEGLDPTRLLVYPISHRDYLAHLLLGTLLDYPTYFLIPFALAIVAGFGLGWSLPIVLAALFLAYLLMVFASQTVVITLGGVLQSRRFRDITVIVGAGFGMSCWLTSMLFQDSMQRFATGVDVTQLLRTWEPLEWIKWLPPGAAAKAIEQAHVGAWGTSLLWLAVTSVWVVLFAWLWWRITNRLVTGQGFLVGGAGAAPEKERPSAGAERDRGFLWRWIPVDLRELALKELRIRWRTPQSRIAIFYTYVFPTGSLLFFWFYGTSGETDSLMYFEEILSGAVVLYTAFSYWVNAQNMLGWELSGLPTLLLTPLRRQRLFLGKALAQVALNAPPILAATLIVLAIQPSLIALTWLPISIALGLASMAVAAVFSVLFPYPINEQNDFGQNPFGSGGGFLTGLANMTLMPGALALVALPIAAPLALALWLGWDWLALIGAALGLVYGGLLFWYATRTAGRLMVPREPEILEATRSKESGNK